ncbi:MAG: hypothetical protein PHV32_12935, partial [Eubacteriales bacterium]|nr:hypothetical protein [Eubacteriales bacterium]
MVKDIFDSISKQMKDDFENIRVCLSHPGLKGSAFEEVFRNFLASYLPKTLAITQGVIVDVNGNVSRQLDIIIYDALHTPIFFENVTTRVIPVECVYAVVDVKAFIDSNEIENIYTYMLSVRDMQKVALIPWIEE